MSSTIVMLRDGQASFAASIDRERFELLAPVGEGGASAGGNDLNFALSAPIESPPLEEIVDPGERALVVVPVQHDPIGSARLAALLVLRLLDLGLDAADIAILVGRGAAGPVSDEEARAIVGDAAPDGIYVRGHDPRDAPAVADVGATSRGTPVEVNRLLLEFDHVIATGSLGFHPFRGFTGGRDALVPTLASLRTATAHQRLAIDDAGRRRAGVGPGRLDGNVVHEDLEEAARMLHVSFLVNATRDTSGEISHVYAGDWRHAHRRGCAEYSAAHSVRVDARRSLALVSAGPLGDGSLASAHAAAVHAAGVVCEGGAVVVATGHPAAPRALSRSASDASDEPDATVGRALGALATRFRLVLVSPHASEAAAAVGAECYDTVDEALGALGTREGYLIPSARTTLPYVAPAPDPS